MQWWLKQESPEFIRGECQVEDISDEIIRRNDAEVLKQAFGRLTKRERQILTMRYGEEKSLQEVSVKTGITRERVRQLEAKTLAKLARYCRDQNIITVREYLTIDPAVMETIKEMLEKEERAKQREQAKKLREEKKARKQRRKRRKQRRAYRW